MSFYVDEFWLAFEAAGMLVDCTFLQPGGHVPKTVKVRWKEPDVEDMNGHQSKYFEIEYRHKDMPLLVEGDRLAIAESDDVTTDYRVRRPPYVNEESGSDGSYRCAVLTREAARDS